MGCNCGGGKRRKPPTKTYTVMGGYKYLTDKQIASRLEVFKKLYCKDCDDRYKCNFEMYNSCTKVAKGG